VIYEFVYDGPILTANEQRRVKNPHALNKRIAEIKDAALILFRSQHKGVKPTDKRVSVEIWDQCTTANLRDIDAQAPTIKAVLDSLQGILYDDDSQVRPEILWGCEKAPDRKNRIVFRFEVYDG
jgi:hypothetical protein